MAMAERKSNIRLTKDTPYLALTGELWGVICEDFGENWTRYNGTTLHCLAPNRRRSITPDNDVATFHFALQLYLSIVHGALGTQSPANWNPIEL